MQAVRALEYNGTRKASKENELHIQARLQNVRNKKNELKEKAREWDRRQADRLADITTQAAQHMQLPRVLEDATNTVRQHRAERVDAQVRAAALEEELRIVKQQQAEAEAARIASAGELEILKVWPGEWPCAPVHMQCCSLCTPVHQPCTRVLQCAAAPCSRDLHGCCCTCTQCSAVNACSPRGLRVMWAFECTLGLHPRACLMTERCSSRSAGALCC
jgi:hypothetical protein